jgi:TolB protein
MGNGENRGCADIVGEQSMRLNRHVRSRRALFGLLLFLGVIAVGALWLASRGFLSDDEAESEPAVNRIAFVGNDGNLWLTRPDGLELQSITTDGKGYLFPAWSPDSHRLAFLGPDDEGNAALYGYKDTSDRPQILFNRRDAAPFYIYWSPDNRSVTFLTQELVRLTMRVADADQPGSERTMGEGAPFYWVWSPEGDRILMHVGGSRAVFEGAHLSELENREGAQRQEFQVAPGTFQTPLWSHSGQHVFYIALDQEEGDAIYKTEMDTSVQTRIAQLSGPTFMVLSPDDQHIAYLRLQSADQFPAIGSGIIIDTQGENERTLLEDSVAAMYWSPDGKKLALLTPLVANRFRWWIYDVENEVLEPLISFLPTLDFLQTVPFFDQYHQSLTFWSPDSHYFVVTKRNEDGSDAGVWILDTTGQEVARKIGDGTFAVWSWQ